MVLTKAIFIVKDWITMLRKERGACRQKAATVLPNRTAAT